MDMKQPRVFMYSDDFPEGKMFTVDDAASLGDEWRDAPSESDNPAEGSRFDDLMHKHLNGEKVGIKADFVELANYLGAGIDPDPEKDSPAIKILRTGIEATVKEAALLAEVSRDDVTFANICDYIKATEGDDGNDG